MPRPRLPQETIENIERVWAKNPTQTAKEVFERLEEEYWKGYVGIRKVQEVVRERKRRGVGKFEFKQWKPWRDLEESPDDTAYLFRLQSITLARTYRGLWEHEAKWARRIRPSLEGLGDIFSHWYLMKCYAELDRVAQFLERPPDTNDLDAKLMCREWTPEGKRLYDIGIENRRWHEFEIDGYSLDRTYEGGHDMDFFECCQERYQGIVQKAAEEPFE